VGARPGQSLVIPAQNYLLAQLRLKPFSITAIWEHTNYTQQLFLREVLLVGTEEEEEVANRVKMHPTET
jgi:hypothetical protein